ncbi:hypothetical protein SGF_01553 [Shigella flexneri CDC 796-83]|uniref:Uncharacterized protein n=1 Tax=Shigella flexneri CDC 796-83 TaxID=945360 RepID=A0A6N3QRF1_SHIFL|nr:hypothetical protein SGF_01553 [Shigella flexneri CDC 796-83]
MLLQPLGGVVHLVTVSAFYEKIILCINIYIENSWVMTPTY